MNAKLDVLNFKNVEIVCEVVDGVFGRKVRKAARNNSENALSLIERSRDLF